MNIAEEAFAQLDRILTTNKRKDAANGKPWYNKYRNDTAAKKKWWKRQITKAINQLNKDDEWFQKTYGSSYNRCKQFIKSRGKRLKTSKY